MREKSTAGPLGTVIAIKLEGNKFFKKESYEDAANMYHKAIIELEELKANKVGVPKKEITELDVSCRLNYANAKSKIKQYDDAIYQVKKVLKLGSNLKAYFRLGDCYYNMG